MADYIANGETPKILTELANPGHCKNRLSDSPFHGIHGGALGTCSDFECSSQSVPHEQVPL